MSDQLKSNEELQAEYLKVSGYLQYLSDQVNGAARHTEAKAYPGMLAKFNAVNDRLRQLEAEMQRRGVEV